MPHTRVLLSLANSFCFFFREKTLSPVMHGRKKSLTTSAVFTEGQTCLEKKRDVQYMKRLA